MVGVIVYWTCCWLALVLVIGVAGIEDPQLFEHAVGPDTEGGFVTVHVKAEEATEEVRLTAALVVPEHISWVVGVQDATGTGWTVTRKVLGPPEQPFACATTLYETTPAVVPLFCRVWPIELPQVEEQSENPVIFPPVGGVD
jgi:hypothetical protein